MGDAVLVTGGAGYIGSQTVPRQIAEPAGGRAGRFFHRQRWAVPPEAVVVAGDAGDQALAGVLIEQHASLQFQGSWTIQQCCVPLGYPDTVDRVLDSFERNGVDPGRVELQGWIKDRRRHLDLYENIDIALDTFPYNGTTTTCEALWMGVPVVSLAGSASMSRVGAAILRCVGLTELVARSIDEYADIAIALARDEARRKALRSSMRTRLISSPLLDHAGFTRKLERHFRQSWTEWCDRSRA